MAQKIIIFDSGAVGEFRTWRWPQRAGIYRYMPFRSVNHLRMGERIREVGSAKCYYERNGQKTFFSVIGSPKYGYLKLAAFGI